MGFVIRQTGEERLVGRDEAQVASVSQFQELRLEPALFQEPMALELHVNGIGTEQRHQAVEPRRGSVRSVGTEDPVDSAVRAAGQDEDARRAARQAVARDMRRIAGRRIEIGLGPEPHQIGIARFRRGQQHDGAASLARPVAAEKRRVAEIDRELDPDDRLNALLGQLLGKLQRSEEVVRVRDGQRRHRVRRCEFTELRNRQRALAQREGAVHVQVNEAGSLIHHPHAHHISTRHAAPAGIASRGHPSSDPLDSGVRAPAYGWASKATEHRKAARDKISKASAAKRFSIKALQLFSQPILVHVLFYRKLQYAPGVAMVNRGPAGIGPPD